MRKTLIAATLAIALIGCTGPNGRIDYGNTALLGAGVGAGTFLLGGAIKGDQHYRQRHYGNPYQGYGYGGGYNRGYGGGYGYQQQPYGGLFGPRGW